MRSTTKTAIQLSTVLAAFLTASPAAFAYCSPQNGNDIYYSNLPTLTSAKYCAFETAPFGQDYSSIICNGVVAIYLCNNLTDNSYDLVPVKTRALGEMAKYGFAPLSSSDQADLMSQNTITFVSKASDK